MYNTGAEVAGSGTFFVPLVNVSQSRIAGKVPPVCGPCVPPVASATTRQTSGGHFAMATLCACGCGLQVKPGRKYRHGHWAKTPEGRQLRRECRIGQRLSPETRAKMSAAHVGHSVSDRMMAALTARNKSGWQKTVADKISKTLTGRTLPPEHVSKLKAKEKLLVSRSKEVIDLKSQLNRLNNGIKEMSSFFKQSEVLGTVDGQDNSAVSPKGESKTAEENPASAQAKGKPIASPAPDAVLENVSPEFFERLTLELTQTIGPMAPLIVRDHVKGLGETMEQFPKARVKELLETVSTEILDEKVKTGFRERIAQINGHL